jgi:hypothetical protein
MMKVSHILDDENKADDQDDLDMDPPPRRAQAGPSSLLSQLMGGGMGQFGGFHTAAPPE